jgi:SecE/Sec61-gamma subunits of protein translocation complex
MAHNSSTDAQSVSLRLPPLVRPPQRRLRTTNVLPLASLQPLTAHLADRKEFIKISQAVGMGFLIMGAIGYFIKLSMRSDTSAGGGGLLTTAVHIPVNNVLVG